MLPSHVSERVSGSADPSVDQLDWVADVSDSGLLTHSQAVLPVDDLIVTATVIIADDHALVRSGLRLIVEDNGFVVVAEAADIAETSRKVRAYKPDLLILDLSMPDGLSLKAIPGLLAASPETAIIVLTMYADPRAAHAALRAGAYGFVPKAAADRELIDALRAALQGHRYLDPELGVEIALEPTAPQGPPGGLTPRELDVLKLVALGFTNTEIARHLYINARTVEAHRSNIEHKLKVTTRAALVAYAMEHQLLDDPFLP